MRTMTYFRFQAVILLALTIFSTAFFSTALFSAPRREKDNPSVRWDTPTDFAFEGGTILDFLRLRSESDGFSFLLDRRIDPSAPVSVSATSIPLIEGLAGAVESAGFEFACLGNVFYVGPKDAAGTLLLDRAIRNDRRLFSANPASERLTTSIRFAAADGSVPSELLAGAAKQVKMSWEKLDLMPFDVWREIAATRLPAEDVFSLVLIGFNVTWQLDDKRPILRPCAFRPDETVTRTYPIDAAEKIDRASFADVQWERIAGTIRASGPFRAMAPVEYAIGKEELKRLLAASNSPAQNTPVSAADAERRITGVVRQVPLKSVFASLEKQLGVVCVLDSSAERLGISPETRVSCRFDKADRKRALKILADTLNLSVRIHGDRALFQAKSP